ncbi:MAG: hypothetical protein P1U84_12205 [Parvibaculaceae bacterium]|nr:hypothetical protein [Parvibaculaceae bacterium]
MAIIYPLALPSYDELPSVSFTRAPVQASAINRETRARDVFVHEGDTWRLEAVISARSIERADKWIDWLMRLDGFVGTFLMGDPFRMVSPVPTIGAPVIAGGGQLGTEIVTGGWAPSEALVLKSGQNIQIGSGLEARLYRVVEDAASDAGGFATVNLRPRVGVATADLTPIQMNGAEGLFRLTSSNLAAWTESRRRETSGLRFTAESVHAA